MVAFLNSTDPKVPIIEWEIFTYSDISEKNCSICQKNIKNEQEVVSHLPLTINKINKYLHFFHWNCFEIYQNYPKRIGHTIQCTDCNTYCKISEKFILNLIIKLDILPNLKKIKNNYIKNINSFHSLITYYYTNKNSIIKEQEKQKQSLEEEIKKLNKISKNNFLNKKEKINKDFFQYKIFSNEFIRLIQDLSLDSFFELFQKSDQELIKESIEFKKLKEFFQKILKDEIDCYAYIYDYITIQLSLIYKELNEKITSDFNKILYIQDITSASFPEIKEILKAFFEKIKNEIDQILLKEE